MLNADSGHCNSDNYYKEITQLVDLKGNILPSHNAELYLIKDALLYNANMPYCPILVEIVQQKIIDSYDGKKFLL